MPAGAYYSGVHCVGGETQGGYYEVPQGYSQPVLWNKTASSMVSLLPTTGGWVSGAVRGVDGNRQFGSVGVAQGAFYHAALWRGTADSFVDMHPTGDVARSSGFNSMRGSQATGSANFYNDATKTTVTEKPVVWNLDTGAYTVINPVSSDVVRAAIFATDGTRQGGQVYLTFNRGWHASLWSGTSESWVDLHPSSAFRSSEVNGMDTLFQVGEAVTTLGKTRGALWQGTSASFIDMTPSFATNAILYATVDGYHVGNALLSTGWTAGLWIGTDPNSFINLNLYLPPGWYGGSATSITRVGDTLYIGGTAAEIGVGRGQAMLWTYTIPGPGAGSLLVGGLCGMGRRRRGALTSASASR